MCQGVVLEVGVDLLDDRVTDQVPGRLVVRRIPDLNPHTNNGQQTLFDTWRFHAFFTTTSPEILNTVAADKTHRRPTGAGKTTLVNLIMWFYELNGGRITLDGVDIPELTRHDLRSRIGMVLQDTWLFGGTIRDNIAYGRPDATEEEILEAARATFVDRFVHNLPDGYDTLVDEDGSNISAGERQLVTIARAFLADPALLILDEATSSVDTRTELLLQQAMASLRTDRTSFVIAHRLSTIRDADLILVMEAGAIVEQGTHPDLPAADGAYAALYNSQFAHALV